MQAIIFFEPIVTNEYLETLPEEGKEVCVDLLKGRKYLVRTGDKEVEVHDVPANRDEIPDNALFEDEAVIAYCEIKYCDYVSLEGLHPNRTIRLADDWILLTDYVEQAARIKRYSDRISKLITLKAPAVIISNEKNNLRRLITELYAIENKLNDVKQRRKEIKLCRRMFMGENISSEVRLLEAIFGGMHDRTFETIPALDIIRETALRINSEDDFYAYVDIACSLREIARANRALTSALNENDNIESHDARTNKVFIENALWWMLSSPIADTSIAQDNRPHSIYEFGLTVIEGKVVPTDEDQ